MKWINARLDGMPPQEFYALVVRGYKDFTLARGVTVRASFIALVDGCGEYSLYHPFWKQSLLKTCIESVYPEMEHEGIDIRPNTLYQFVDPSEWYFRAEDITEWQSIAMENEDE